MATVHGSKSSFQLGTLALPATLVNLSTYVNLANVGLTRDQAETTTLGKVSKTHIPGLKDGTFPVEGPYDPVIEQQLWDLYNNATIVNFAYAPAGLAVTGTALFAGTGFCTAFNVDSNLSSPVAVKSSFQITGDVTRTVQ